MAPGGAPRTTTHPGHLTYQVSDGAESVVSATDQPAEFNLRHPVGTCVEKDRRWRKDAPRMFARARASAERVGYNGRSQRKATS